MYLKIFLKYKLNFETIFAYLPLKKMHQLYGVYHEMDVTQFYRYFESLREKNTFSIFLKEKELTLKALSDKTGISVATLKSLKEGKRNFKNLKSSYLEKISHYLGVEMQTLLGEITLEIK